jgi:transposase InsO family protein
MQIYPGSPWENGYNERFNGTLRKKSSTLNGSTPHLMVVKKASMMGGVF